MFEYAFSELAIHKKCIESDGRYATQSYSEGVLIKVLRADAIVRIETQGGFEYANKSIYLTKEDIAPKDLLDGHPVKGVRRVCDVFGDLVYNEVQFS